MKTFVCHNCFHVTFDEAPVECPVCGVAIENFDNVEGAIKKPADPDNLSELDKMHVPVMRVNRQCSLDASVTCIDVLIQVGEVIHPMESEHLIDFIDLYVNKKYFTRLSLTHKLLYPAVAVHPSIKEGVFKAIAHCNVHGHWMARIRLDASSH